MADNRYGEPRGSSWSDRDREQGRWRGNDEQSWRDAERARPGWGATDERGRHGDDDRGEGGSGFFERAGQEIRSWFSDDDNDDRRDDRDRSRRDYDQSGNYRGHAQSWGEANRGENWRSGSGGGSDFSRGRGAWSDQPREGYGRARGFGGGRAEAGARGRDSFGGRGSAESIDRGQSGQHFGYNDMSGMMGGFGNQRFGSSQDDHYLSWRNKQLEQLDRDYQDYCRENEQQFHQNFDSWRQSRQSQTGQQAGGMSATGETGSSSSGQATGSSSASGGQSSLIGGGSSDASAATAGGGGDPTPEPATPRGGSRSGSRTRS